MVLWGLSDRCVARELEEVPEASSVLLLSAHAPGYFQRPDVWPFVQQLRCYATQRGMRFEAKSGPWPVQHETVAVIEVSWNLHQFWATRKPPGDCFFFGIFCQKRERKGRVLFSFSISIGVSVQLCLYFYIQLILALSFMSSKLWDFCFQHLSTQVRIFQWETRIWKVCLMMCWQRITLAELPSYLNGQIFCSLVVKHFFVMTAFQQLVMKLQHVFFLLSQTKTAATLLELAPNLPFVGTCFCFLPRQRFPPSCF